MWYVMGRRRKGDGVDRRKGQMGIGDSRAKGRGPLACGPGGRGFENPQGELLPAGVVRG